MDDSFLYPFLNRPKVRVQNTASSDIPPGGVMRITNGSFSGKNAIVSVAQPDNQLRRRYLVNCGPLIKANSGTGWGTSLFTDGLVAYDSSGTPQPDEQWGPFPNSWLLRSGYQGFIITGGTKDFGSFHGTVAVQINPMRAWGFASSSIDAGATGTVTLYAGLPGTSGSLMTVTNCKNFGVYIHANMGVEVVWATKDPVVRRLDSNILRCNANSGIAYGASASCQVLDGGGATTGDTISVANRFATAGIGVNKQIAVAWDGLSLTHYAIENEHASV